MTRRIHTRVVWDEQGRVIEDVGYDYDGPVAEAKTNPVLVQSHFRFRSDAGAVDATPTWIASEDTNVNIDVSGGNVKFRLRFAVQETGGADANSSTYTVRSSLDSYAAVIGTGSTGVRSADASSDASGTNIVTNRLSGTGSYAGGEYDEDGTSDAFIVTASKWAEFEYGLELVAADLTDGQVINFQCYFASTPLNSILVVPRVTVSKSPAFGSQIESASVSLAAGTTVTTQKMAVVAGSLLIASAERTGGSGTPTISDSGTNSWTELDNTTARSWQYAIAASTAEISITSTISGSGTLDVIVSVFKGAFESSPLDTNPTWVTDTSDPRGSIV